MTHPSQKLDGTALAAKIREELRVRVAAMPAKPRLVILRAGDDAVSARFSRMKRKFGEAIGVAVEEVALPAETATEVLTARVAAADAPILVQLPLPAHIDTPVVLSAIPLHFDVDALSGNARFAAPVARAVELLLAEARISPKGLRAVVIGKGRLVGLPVAAMLRRAGALVEALDIQTKDIASHTRDADIIVSGAGRPGFVTPDMLTEGVVLVDAGTSEKEGVLMGDIEPSCYPFARAYTPVPGGVGPVTVAALFENVVAAV